MASIAVLGYGTVGTGITELITKNRERFKKITGEELKISSILVRDIEKHREKVYSNLLTNNIEDIFRKSVDIVVEVMGGIDPAYEYIKRALKLKKHVVTANKDLIAEHGKELLDLADKNGVTLNFEASVGGGIPILKPLMECLMGNEIKNIKAILNGTTNFILTKMDKEDISYEDALKEAQQLGFAEANPESDVLGYDAARKLSILSTIAYNEKLNWKDIVTEGITQIDKEDFKYARAHGYNIKLLAISSREEDKIYAAVKPVMVKNNSQLGKVENELNAIVLEGDAVGKVLFTGKGAGMLPTASSVFGDITDIIQNKNKKVLRFNEKEASVQKYWNNSSSWFVRIKTKARIEVMCSIAGDFENCHIFSKYATNPGEVVALVKCKSEDFLSAKINKLLELPYVHEIKRFSIIEN
ncbi:homoserine dehydrogenase [Clostridium sp. CX1]|uniref:homoserine dehydrogenase n=1 Tax=Clostridium sp. CX1 TaxID=2978346 RepID=UPI0021BFC283|nr:homoserine dehydrogenase [Clostridium sp. CX1]MCT8977950.1 homoserine dehydrogenase [Clostridium sp. CX1]